MRWSITLGRFGGTAVKIYITFILFLAWIAFSAWARGGPAAALDSTLFVVLLFACVVLDEFGHIAAARRYGIGDVGGDARCRSAAWRACSACPATPPRSLWSRSPGPPSIS